MPDTVTSLSLTAANKILATLGDKPITRRRFYTFALSIDRGDGEIVIVVGPPQGAYKTANFTHVLQIHRLAKSKPFTTSDYIASMDAAWQVTRKHKYTALFSNLIPENVYIHFTRLGWQTWKDGVHPEGIGRIVGG